MQIEIHITTSALANKELDNFILFCQKINVKPIVIELNDAEVKQHPMISKTVAVNDKAELDHAINDLKNAFLQAGYAVVRVKLEVELNEADNGKKYFPDYKGGYYEWHGQVREQDIKKISGCSSSKDVHISKNALRDRTEKRILTIRNSYKKALLLNKVKWLKRDLKKLSISISNEHYEYCIYDSNKSLDHGWIETPEITDKAYLDLLSFEAFLRRAATLDMPFMLKGSLLSRQYYKNKNDRAVEDMDFLYFGESRDDEDFMSSQLSDWAQAVTCVELEDGVAFNAFNRNRFWRMMEYAMHDDFPTVNTDLWCKVRGTINPEVGLDVSWGLPLNVKPVAIEYQPLEGKPFELKYTTPLSLQISWKLHQCVVRPRLKDMIDICDLLTDVRPSKEIIVEAIQEYVFECKKDRIDPNNILSYVDGSIRKYLNYEPDIIKNILRISKKGKQPLPDMGELTYKCMDYLQHVFPNCYQKYGCVDDILSNFERSLNEFDIHLVVKRLLQ